MIDKIIEWASSAIRSWPLVFGAVCVGLIARDCHRDAQEVKQSLREIRTKVETTNILLDVANRHLDEIEGSLEEMRSK